MPTEAAHHCLSLEAAAELLKQELCPGDLVLLKGRSTDHLTRIYFAQFGPVACWRSHCRKTCLCDGCDELGAEPETGEPFAPFRAYRFG
jgi:UDP-N-acetylmuramoyl-tripeptide--D-alanyl-D-alanine ligase